MSACRCLPLRRLAPGNREHAHLERGLATHLFLHSIGCAQPARQRDVCIVCVVSGLLCHLRDAHGRVYRGHGKLYGLSRVIAGCCGVVAVEMRGWLHVKLRVLARLRLKATALTFRPLPVRKEMTRPHVERIMQRCLEMFEARAL